MPSSNTIGREVRQHKYIQKKYLIRGRWGKMRKTAGAIYFFLALFFIVMSGCSATASKETETSENINSENEKKAEEQKRDSGPPIIEVVDPNTDEVINKIETEKVENKEEFRAEIEQWAKEIARGTEAAEGYDQRMVPDKLGENGEIIKGSPMVILEEEELVERIMKAFEKGGKVELPLYTTESQYDPEEVPFLDEVVVSSYTTYFNHSVAGRTKNIELSAAAINNVIIGIDDQFSFNTTVGPSDEAHGYQPAQVAVNGRLVMGIGGGICQTSSTLYNAVDYLGVDYLEKHNHSVNVSYVPKGRDATVSYGGLDFRFKNTTGVPLLLKAYTNNGSLTVEVRTSKKNYEILKQN